MRGLEALLKTKTNSKKESWAENRITKTVEVVCMLKDSSTDRTKQKITTTSNSFIKHTIIIKYMYKY